MNSSKTQIDLSGDKVKGVVYETSPEYQVAASVQDNYHFYSTSEKFTRARYITVKGYARERSHEHQPHTLYASVPLTTETVILNPLRSLYKAGAIAILTGLLLLVELSIFNQISREFAVPFILGSLLLLFSFSDEIRNNKYVKSKI